MKISISDTRKNVRKVMETALNGEEVIITKRDQPIAKVLKIEETDGATSLPSMKDFRKKWSETPASSSVLEMRDEDERP